ncbi:MAG: protein kinase [Kofleriaceae bacterium]|nr:protein kinase [Kofleriaceae bacterium]
MSSGDATLARLGRPGQLIDGRYRLAEMLGAGGFGEVWRARQEVEGAEVRTVALKLLVPPGDGGGTPTLGGASPGSGRGPGPTGSGGSGGLSRSGGPHTWLDEVRAVREVRCSSIVTIYDVGIARDPRVAFIAMELLQGETLGDRLHRGALYWRRALAVARPVADALAVCHAAGVAHCDLKPANVFLSASGAVHVLDFGVASLGGQRRDVAAELVDLAPGGATGAVSMDEMPDVAAAAGSTVVVGTPGYIPPESFDGLPPAPAGDVYALGVMLYRAIAGRLPYRVPDDLATGNTLSRLDVERWHAALNTATVRGEVVPLTEAAPDVPPAVATLIDRMLALRPEARPTGDLVAALDEAWLRPWGVPDPPYVGLAAFDHRRAGHIFGRDGDVDAIAALLQARRALVLAGPSGCGKSSLAIAGVASRLDRDLIDGVDGWQLVAVRPSEGARALAIADGAVAPPSRLGLAVVIDQLEELLRLPADERDRFADAMVAIAEGSAPVAVRGQVIAAGAPARLIATVRDDLLGPVAALPALDRLPERNLFTVRGVATSAIGDLVEAPARAAGFALEGVAEVVAEARRILDSDPGALPLVQFALTRWWEGRDLDRKVLPRAVWDAIGGIEGALAEAAQAVFEQLDGAARDAMRSVLVQLFRPDGTRVRLAEAQLASHDGERRVLARLVERRLITRVVDDAGAASLEVVHEALGRRWPTLRSWLDETRAERELLADCEDDAAQWQRSGRPPDLLWRGARLAAAVGVRAKLGAAALEFVDAAATAAGRQQRWTRRAVGAALLMLAVAAAVLIVSFRAAQRDRARAAHAREQAEVERGHAEAARVDADKARLQAEADASASQLARQRAEIAQAEAERERDAARDTSRENQRLRDEATRAAEAARAAEARAMAERAETLKQAERVREAVERAETERRRAESQRIYAETAQQLHELASKRLAEVEERATALEAQVQALQRQVAQCRDDGGTR